MLAWPVAMQQLFLGVALVSVTMPHPPGVRYHKMNANLEYGGWQLGVGLLTLAYIAPQSIAVPV
jgi:hypothetical protein